MKYTVLEKNSQTWYKYQTRELHREDDLPAIINPKYQEYFLNGKRHRDNAPAIVWDDGDYEYYTDGYLHRTDGPAVYIIHTFTGSLSKNPEIKYYLYDEHIPASSDEEFFHYQKLQAFL